jgi:crossover junction endodeoxyribonuclease RuvC
MEYVIALDLSLSSSGVAIFSQDGKLKKLITIETDAKSETQIRLKKIGTELNKIKKEYKPKVVVSEHGFTRFHKSTQLLFMVHGISQYIYSDKEIVYYYPMTIRKIVCGKGNVDKEYVRDFINSKYGNIKFKNYDESDATAIGLAYFIDTGVITND